MTGPARHASTSGSHCPPCSWGRLVRRSSPSIPTLPLCRLLVCLWLQQCPGKASPPPGGQLTSFLPTQSQACLAWLGIPQVRSPFRSLSSEASRRLELQKSEVEPPVCPVWKLRDATLPSSDSSAWPLLCSFSSFFVSCTRGGLFPSKLEPPLVAWESVPLSTFLHCLRDVRVETLARCSHPNCPFVSLLNKLLSIPNH